MLLYLKCVVHYSSLLQKMKLDRARYSPPSSFANNVKKIMPVQARKMIIGHLSFIPGLFPKSVAVTKHSSDTIIPATPKITIKAAVE